MKKQLFYPTLLVIILLLVFALGACNDAGEGSETSTDTATTSVDSMTRHNNLAPATTDTANKSSGPVSKDDSSFLAAAASGGAMEVELGQVAQQNAYSQRVKDFGSMMVRDHSAANTELKQLASNKNVSLPQEMESKHKRHYENISKKKGNSFDKDYMKMMVDDHEKDINEFEKAASNAQDADIKAFAAKTLPVLRTHLDSAKAIAKQ